MRLQGIDAYVLPTEYLAQPQKYMPYLFTDDELIRFSQVIDTIPHTGNGSFEDYTLPVFFRIAYGCGLRPNELFNLRRYDVHFDDKYIFNNHGINNQGGNQSGTIVNHYHAEKNEKLLLIERVEKVEHEITKLNEKIYKLIGGGL